MNQNGQFILNTLIKMKQPATATTIVSYVADITGVSLRHRNSATQQNSSSLHKIQLNTNYNLNTIDTILCLIVKKKV